MIHHIGHESNNTFCKLEVKLIHNEFENLVKVFDQVNKIAKSLCFVEPV
jgi:hypothetical protein